MPGDGRGHGRSRIATKRKEECEPTVTMLDAYTRRESVWSSVSYLNLQDVIATETLVMHIVVRVIGIATVLVFDKGEAGRRVS